MLTIIYVQITLACKSKYSTVPQGFNLDALSIIGLRNINFHSKDRIFVQYDIFRSD